MFGTQFSHSFCGNIPNDDVATARGDLNTMVTPSDRQFSFDFNVIEVDDLLASASNLTIEDDAWLKALSSDDWESQLGLTASPLLSESPTLSALSCSSSTSASVSPQPSPAYVSPALPEVELFPPFDSMFNESFASTGLQQVQCPSASTSSAHALRNHGGEALQEDVLDWDPSRRPDEDAYQSIDSGQHYVPDNDALEGNALIAHTGAQSHTDPEEEPTRLLDRTFSPRRAASITKRRLEVLFKDEEVEEEDDNFGGTEVQLSRNARIRKCSMNINSSKTTSSGKHASKKRRVRSSTSIDYDSFDDTSDSYSDEERVEKKLAPISSPDARTITTKRITYSDLVSSQHPITRPSITSTFVLSPSDCNHCIQGFMRMGDLIRHLKAYHQVHDEDKALACSGCGTQFSRSDALRRHRERGTCKGKKRKRRMRKWEVEAALAVRKERAGHGSS